MLNSKTKNIILNQIINNFNEKVQMADNYRIIQLRSVFKRFPKATKEAYINKYTNNYYDKILY